jgi:hypothetical protein
MRWWTAVFVVALLNASCSSRSPLQRAWSKLDWNVQQHVFESRAAWDQGTGRANEYEAGGAQLAR